MISSLALSAIFIFASQTPEAPAAPAASAPAVSATGDGIAETVAPAEEAEVDTAAAPPPANRTDDAPPPGAGFSTDIDDDTPPRLEDFAVASGSLDAPPRATAVVTDDASGVEKVLVFFRAKNAPAYSAVALSPGDGGLFVGSLEEGIQLKGFDYYVEVKDAAGNVTKLGSEDRPIFIEPVKRSVGATYETPKPEVTGPPIASYWVAGAFAVGVVASVVAALAAFDVGRSQLILNSDTEFVQGLGILEDDYELTDTERSDLSQSTIGSGAVLGIAGLIAVVGLSAGTGMLIFNAVSE